MTGRRIGVAGRYTQFDGTPYNKIDHRPRAFEMRVSIRTVTAEDPGDFQFCPVFFTLIDKIAIVIGHFPPEQNVIRLST